MAILRTPRLLLMQGSLKALTAELESPEALGEALAVDAPSTWPPELYDADAVRWTIEWLTTHPREAAGSMYYIAEASVSTGARAQLIGVAGFKGGPDDTGVVEIGYGILAERRRRGFASEAVRALLALAFDDQRVSTVVAHTLPELAASIGVLRATGFTYDGPGNDSHEPSAIRYVLPRGRYQELQARHDARPTTVESTASEPSVT
jgi:ribosomal-protein-alanine N-acetyltransferase